jgi:hypothetical protein
LVVAFVVDVVAAEGVWVAAAELVAGTADV